MSLPLADILYTCGIVFVSGLVTGAGLMWFCFYLGEQVHRRRPVLGREVVRR